MFIDAENLCGWAMSESLPYDEIEFYRIVTLEEFLKTPDDSDIGYFVEVDLKNPDNIHYKTKNFPFAPKNRIINPDYFSEFMKTIKLVT